MKHPIKLALVLATCFTPACISPGCFLKPTQAFDAASLAYVRHSLANKLPECLASGAALLAMVVARTARR